MASTDPRAPLDWPRPCCAVDGVVCVLRLCWIQLPGVASGTITNYRVWFWSSFMAVAVSLCDLQPLIYCCRCAWDSRCC